MPAGTTARLDRRRRFLPLLLAVPRPDASSIAASGRSPPPAGRAPAPSATRTLRLQTRSDLFDTPSPSEDGRSCSSSGGSRRERHGPEHRRNLSRDRCPIRSPPRASCRSPIGRPGRPGIGTISTARWLSHTRLMCVGPVGTCIRRETNGAPLDTLVTGLEVWRWTSRGRPARVSARAEYQWREFRRPLRRPRHLLLHPDQRQPGLSPGPRHGTVLRRARFRRARASRAT